MNEFLTRLDVKAGMLATTLTPIAFVLIVFSLWSSVSNGNRSATMYLRALVHAIVVVTVLSQFSNWLRTGESVVESLVYDTLQADPGQVYEKYKSMTVATTDEAEGGFWHTIFNLSEKEIVKGIITAVLWTVQFFAKVVVFIADIIYSVLLAFAVAASPIFIGFLSVRSLSSVGARFILGTVGILLWPLGWGFASLVTDTLLETMAPDSTGLEVLKDLLAVAVAGIWIVFSTIAAPLVIQKMITEGANTGTAFLQGGLKATRASVQSAASAGSSMATAGMSAPVTAAGAAVAGVMAFGSSSLSGSGHSSIGESVGSAARMSKAGSSYRSSDPANDRQAASIVSKARRSNQPTS